MKGRKPKPTALKVLAGNPGKRPLNDAEPNFMGERIGNAPKHLSAEAKAEWKRVAPVLKAAGVLTPADRGALAAYCQAWARWVEAERKIETEGMVTTTPSGYEMQSPWVGIANKALELMRAFAAEFGMTPSSRTRVRAEKPEHERSLAEALFEQALQEK